MERNKTVLVTGASRGIGRAVALAFAGAGFRVAANFHKDASRAEALKAEIESAGGVCGLFQGDVSNPEMVRKMAVEVKAAFGHINVIVNNAGICRDRTVVNMSDGEWDDVIQTDLNGPFYVIREFAPLIGAEGGAVINISSIAGIRGNFGGANYAAAKAGLIALTKTAAKELGARKISVNAVLPGFHRTDMGKALPDKYARQIEIESVLNLTTDIAELADFVVFLSRAKTVSGQVFNWDSRIV